MNAEKVAEAFRILGVHGTRRHQLAEALLATETPLTLVELAERSGIHRRKIYYVTELLRDQEILQPTRPIEPRDWRIIYGPQMLNRKRKELGITGPAHYVFNQTRLREAIREKARETAGQILSVLEEAQA